jgi:hypothetical protein
MCSYDKIEATCQIDGPNGHIQWKGTEVCMDLYCSCGKDSHIDASFAYHFRCSCGKLWAISPYVKLVEINDADVINGCIVEDNTIE